MSHSPAILVVVLGLMLAPASSARAGDPAVARVKCEAAKLQAAGNRAACIAKERAKAWAGKPSDPGKCETKFIQAIRTADDAAAKKDAACRFIDNGDGTVTDLDTELQWEQKVAGSACLHCVDDTYSWSAGGVTADGTAFTSFLARLTAACGAEDGVDGIRGGFAGHCDWRLPTLDELLTIRDFTQGNCGGGSGACIDPSFGPTAPSFYWSSTGHENDPGFAMPLFFGNSFPIVYDHSGNTLHYVRAVRGLEFPN